MAMPSDSEFIRSERVCKFINLPLTNDNEYSL
jgi:hypothetical protein